MYSLLGERVAANTCPGWHDAVQDLYESGELQVVGIIQEQHRQDFEVAFEVR